MGRNEVINAVNRVKKAWASMPFSQTGKRAVTADDWQRRYDLLSAQDNALTALQDARKRSDRYIGREIGKTGGLSGLRERQIFGAPAAEDRPAGTDYIKRAPAFKTGQQFLGAIDANVERQKNNRRIASDMAWQRQQENARAAGNIEKANRILNDHPGMMGDIIAKTGKETLEENADYIVDSYERGLAERGRAGQLTDEDRYYIRDIGSWDTQPAERKPEKITAPEMMGMRVRAIAEEVKKNAAARDPEKYAKMAQEKVLASYSVPEAEKLDPTKEDDYRVWRKTVLDASEKRISNLQEYERALEYTGQGDKLPGVREKLAQEQAARKTLEEISPDQWYFMQKSETADQYEQEAQQDKDYWTVVQRGEKKDSDVYLTTGGLPGAKVHRMTSYMTQQERNTALYLAEYHPQEVETYMDAIEPRLNARGAAEKQQQAQEFGEKAPILAAPLSWIASPIASASSLGTTALHAAKNMVTGKEIPVDYNDPGFHQQAAMAGVNSGMLDGHEGAGRFALEVLNSAGQNITNLAYGPAALPMMGVEAAGQGTYDAVGRGASAGKALGYGLTSGGIEMATEYLPTKGLQKAISPAGKVAGEAVSKRIGKAGLNALAQAATEGVEEGVGAIAETAADAIIMKDLSKRNLFIKSAVKHGASEEEAKRAANKMIINDILYSAAQGAASGGLLGGAAEGIGMIRADVNGRQLLQSDGFDVITEAAETLGPDSKSYQLAEKLVEQETVSPEQASDLQETVAEELLQDPQALQKWGKQMGISKEAAAAFAESTGMDEADAQLFAEGFEEAAPQADTAEAEKAAEQVQEEPISMTEDEYLMEKGVSSPVSNFLIDKMRGNRQLKTQRGQERFEKEAEAAENEYYEKRKQAREEYRQLVAEGKVRNKTAIEHELDIAKGHPDNASVQAARRMLKKRGIDWKTGKKLEEIKEQDSISEQQRLTEEEKANMPPEMADRETQLELLEEQQRAWEEENHLLSPEQAEKRKAESHITKEEKENMPPELADRETQLELGEERQRAWEEENGLVDPAKAPPKPKRAETYTDRIFAENPISDNLGLAVQRSAADIRAAEKEKYSLTKLRDKYVEGFSATQLELETARLVAKGKMTVEGTPKGARPEVVAELANYEKQIDAARGKGVQGAKKELWVANHAQAQANLGNMNQLAEDLHYKVPKKMINEDGTIQTENGEPFRLRRPQTTHDLYKKTPGRAFQAVFGLEKGNQLIRQYLKPIYNNEKAKTVFLNKMFKKASELKLNRVERMLTQLVGEGVISIDDVKSKSISREALPKNMAEDEATYVLRKLDRAHPEKVETAAKFFRENYEAMYDIINDFFAKHGMKLTGYQENYFPHFDKDSPLVSMMKKFGIEGTTMLPTKIAGRTADFKPNRRWVGNLEQRQGTSTSYDAYEGYQSYMLAVADMIYHADDVMRLRALDAAVRGMRTDKQQQTTEKEMVANGKAYNEEIVAQFLDGEYGDMEAPEEFSGFAAWLTEFTNHIANKHIVTDRTKEWTDNRVGMNVLNKMISQFARNSVVGNFSSAVNNIVTLPKMLTMLGSEHNAIMALKGLVTGQFKKLGLADKSEFLVSKQGVQRLVQSPSSAAADWVMAHTFGPVEDFMSNISFYSKYLQQIEKGADEATAIDVANDFAANMMARRTKGGLSLKEMTQTFWAKLTTVFQVEVTNDWQTLTQDLPAWVQENIKTEGKNAVIKKIAAGTARYCIYSYLLNSALQALTGYAPAPDPMRWAQEAWEELFGEEAKQENWFERIYNAALKTGENVGSIVPGLTAVLAMAGAENARLPIATIDHKRVMAVGNALFSSEEKMPNKWAYIGENFAKGVLFPMLFNVMPFGGNQLKKTTEGLDIMIRGKATTQSKNGEKLMTGVDNKNIFNWLRAIGFGRGAIKEMREYWDSHDLPLTEQQTQQAYEAEEKGVPLNDFRAYLKERKRQQAADKEKGEKRSSMELTEKALDNMKDLTDEQRAELFAMQHESAGYYQNPFMPNYDRDVAELSKERYADAKKLQRSSGVPVDIYTDVYDYYNHSAGANKKVQVMEYIDSLDMPREQKTALFKVYYTDTKDYDKAAGLQDNYGIPMRTYMDLKKYHSSLKGKKAAKRESLIWQIDSLPLDNNQKDALLYSFYPEG